MKVDEQVIVNPNRFYTVLKEEAYTPLDLVDAWLELWVQIKLKMKRIGADRDLEEKVRAVTHNVYEYRLKAESAIAVEQQFGSYPNWIAAIPYGELADLKKKIGDGTDEVLRLLERN